MSYYPSRFEKELCLFKSFMHNFHLYVDRGVFSLLFLAKTEWTGHWIQLAEVLKQSFFFFFFTSAGKAVAVKSWFNISTSCTPKCTANELLLTIFETLLATMYYWTTVWVFLNEYLMVPLTRNIIKSVIYKFISKMKMHFSSNFEWWKGMKRTWICRRRKAVF